MKPVDEDGEEGKPLCGAGVAAQLWRQYFVEPVDRATHVVVMKKENGESVHLTAVRLAELGGIRRPTGDDEFLLISGSKNNHVAFVTADQLAWYKDDRFQMARSFAQRAYETFQRLSDAKRHSMLAFLADRSVTGVFELLNPLHQHVENLSRLAQPRLQFITWSSHELSSLGLAALAPDEAVAKAKQFDWPHVVVCERIGVAEVDGRMAGVRHWHGIEGCVFYYLTGEGRAIGLIKHKTIWYIIVRAIREKARTAVSRMSRNPNSFSISSSQQALRSRIAEIASWLDIPAACCDRWSELGEAFLRYVCLDNEQSASALNAVFPAIWCEFLKVKRLTDKSDALHCERDPPDNFILCH